MIYEVEGDILLTGAQVIAHGVAANDPMKQGLALALHERYPAMHKDFHHWCHQARPQPGAAWIWASADGKRIVNLLTQEGGYGAGNHPGKATESNVNHALKELKKILQKEKCSSVALPRLATGVGELEWNKVAPLIQAQLGDLAIPVYVYVVYHAGQKANEPG
jgi:O-acetyl-ADP-ribose deacetylase (regulator of RNase III)